MPDVSALLRGFAFDVAQQPASRVPSEFATTLPADTVAAAIVMAGVRLELRGSASALEISFVSAPGPLRAAPTMPAAFSVWLGDRLCSQAPVSPGDSSVLLPLPDRDPNETVVVYLPEPVSVRVSEVTGVDGPIELAPRGPRWLAYGDSITHGWSVSDPGRAWPAVAARHAGLDVVNLGFAGACRGEFATAMQLAASPADVITLAWGTNCWSTIPFDAPLIAHTYRLFLTTVRQEHPDTPIIVVSPILRPDAESRPNRFGATLADLREAIENSVVEFQRRNDDASLRLLRGREIVEESLLVDGIHPGDAGHEAMAKAIVPSLTAGLQTVGR